MGIWNSYQRWRKRQNEKSLKAWDEWCFQKRMESANRGILALIYQLHIDGKSLPFDYTYKDLKTEDGKPIGEWRVTIEKLDGTIENCYYAFEGANNGH